MSAESAKVTGANLVRGVRKWVARGYNVRKANLVRRVREYG
jgi:hypothetical protein